MLGNPKWFERRKYGGWGLHPKTWQGWAYVGVFFGVLLAFQLLPFWDTLTRVIFTTAWALILIIDTMSIMARINLDEREKIHEAIAERNALWGMLAVITGGLVYGIIKSGLEQRFYVNPFLAIALFTGLLIKAISNIYLDKKD